ncbi:hypothetical protein [Rathayibacter sp. AY1F9]|uniref:hypothetical protein n=1 Tax=Rathayibacter sp. AY1F9 TaxID=2080563 RepID=UPI0011B0CFED|nr:hypothetical protein [Rathayibacter sp. AY1F9]
MASAEYERSSADAIVIYPVDRNAAAEARVIVPAYPDYGRAQLPVILATRVGLEFWDGRKADRPAAALPWEDIVGISGPSPASNNRGLRIRARIGERALTAEIPLRPGGVGPQKMPQESIDVLAGRLRALGEAAGFADDIPDVRPTSVQLLPGRDSFSFIIHGFVAFGSGVASFLAFFAIASWIPLEVRTRPIIFVPAILLLAGFFVGLLISWILIARGLSRWNRERSAGYRIRGAPWPVGTPLVDRRTGEVAPVPPGTAPPYVV